MSINHLYHNLFRRISTTTALARDRPVNRLLHPSAVGKTGLNRPSALARQMLRHRPFRQTQVVVLGNCDLKNG